MNFMKYLVDSNWNLGIQKCFEYVVLSSLNMIAHF